MLVFNTALFLIAIIIIGILYYFDKRRKETFVDLANLLTSNTQENVIDYNYTQNNTPCRINTKDGKSFSFVALDSTLDWFKVNDDQFACSLEVSGEDIHNEETACTTFNEKLFDKSVVDDIYMSDPSTDNGQRRCIIKFKRDVSHNDISAYLKKQISYQRIADCAALKEEVKRLLKENEQIRKHIEELERSIIAGNKRADEAKRRELIALERVRVAEVEIQKAQDRIQKAQEARDRYDKMAEKARAEAEALEAAGRAAVNAFEARLLKAQQLEAQEMADIASQRSYEEQVKIRTERSIVSEKQKISAAEQEKARIETQFANDLNSQQKDNQRALTILNSTLTSKQAELDSKKIYLGNLEKRVSYTTSAFDGCCGGNSINQYASFVSNTYSQEACINSCLNDNRCVATDYNAKTGMCQLWGSVNGSPTANVKLGCRGDAVQCYVKHEPGRYPSVG